MQVVQITLLRETRRQLQDRIVDEFGAADDNQPRGIGRLFKQTRRLDRRRGRCGRWRIRVSGRRLIGLEWRRLAFEVTLKHALHGDSEVERLRLPFNQEARIRI